MSKTAKLVDLQNFNMPVEDYDGLLFVKKNGVYIFTLLYLDEATDLEKNFIVNDLGIKYFMIFKNADKTLDISEAILGDPLRIIKNFVKAGSEGIIIKKCAGAEKIIQKYLK